MGVPVHPSKAGIFVWADFSKVGANLYFPVWVVFVVLFCWGFFNGSDCVCVVLRGFFLFFFFWLCFVLFFVGWCSLCQTRERGRGGGGREKEKVSLSL